MSLMVGLLLSASGMTSEIGVVKGVIIAIGIFIGDIFIGKLRQGIHCKE